MSASRPIMRALPLAFLLYALQAALALLVALPLGLELSGDVRATLADALGRAVWLDRVAELVPVVRAQALSAALIGVFWLALSPWLQMAWLCALERSCSVGAALGAGARLYFRALRVSLLVAALLGLALLPLLAALGVASWRFSDHAHARQHDLSLAGGAVSLALLLWIAHVLHDLARARALHAGAWTAVRSSLGAALRPGVQASALGWLLLALGLRASHWLIHALGPALPSAVAVALLQSACFAALLARGAWLARTLACAGAPRASRTAT